MADVTQTEDADHPLALVHHRQPAQLKRLHVPHRLGEIIIVPAAMDAGGHHIARPASKLSCANPWADDVAVGHHADQPVVLSDRNGAYIMLTHQFREFGMSGLTQWSLTCMADLRCWSLIAPDEMPSRSIIFSAAA
jgi:hypothetical protein